MFDPERPPEHGQLPGALLQPKGPTIECKNSREANATQPRQYPAYDPVGATSIHTPQTQQARTTKDEPLQYNSQPCAA